LEALRTYRRYAKGARVAIVRKGIDDVYERLLWLRLRIRVGIMSLMLAQSNPQIRVRQCREEDCLLRMLSARGIGKWMRTLGWEMDEQEGCHQHTAVRRQAVQCPRMAPEMQDLQRCGRVEGRCRVLHGQSRVSTLHIDESYAKGARTAAVKGLGLRKVLWLETGDLR
jgi:hypothetical protein